MNREISASEIRLIDEAGEQVGVVNTVEALERAEKEELDLVEISPESQPPVCRIMNYGKFLYQQKKRQVQAKKHQSQIQLKEIKVRLTTDDNDLAVKMRKARGFLSEGNKVKISLRFRGREIAYQEMAIKLLEKIQQQLEGSGVVEQKPKTEGRQMMMVVAPTKK